MPTDGYHTIPGQEYPDRNPDAVGDDSFALNLEEQHTPDTDNQWVALAESIYETSQDYYEQSLQRNWQRNARHWNNQFDDGSKFYTDSYRYRSRLFRPLVRTAERNSSAATAVALFSSQDVISIEPQDKTDPAAAGGAMVMKELLEYRLEEDCDWYLTALGAWQDSRIYGPCVSYVYWNFEERIDMQEAVVGQMTDEAGTIFDMIEQRESRTTVKDGLAIDLVPPEYFRADPACDWRNVIQDSPYIIRIVPMYVTDVEEKIKLGDWLPHTRAQILSAGDKNLEYDAIRRAREGDERADSIDDTTRTEDTDFEIIFCHENYVRLEGKEWVYWTLGTQSLLSEPKPLEEVYFHGKRPMVYGFSVIEAHKYAPNGASELITDLQEHINDISNQRIDNIRLALNKRYIVRRGAQVDLQALARNVPGGSITTDNPETDINVVSTPDVTQSSYTEHERLAVEANELTGTFSGGSVQNNRALNETATGMQMLSDGANQLQEFDIRTWVETWVKPTLQLALWTIQKYETNPTIVAIAGQRAASFPKWGESYQMPEAKDLWDDTLKLKINVGLGATSPFQRIQTLQFGLNAIVPFVDPMQFKNDEIVKEVMGAIGHADGTRFIKTQEEVQQELEQNPPPPPPEVQKAQADAEAKTQLAQINAQAVAEREQAKQQFDLQKEQMRLAFEAEQRNLDRQAKLAAEVMRIASEENKTVAQIEKELQISVMQDETKRATTLIQEVNKEQEMKLKREMGTGI